MRQTEGKFPTLVEELPALLLTKELLVLPACTQQQLQEMIALWRDILSTLARGGGNS